MGFGDSPYGIGSYGGALSSITISVASAWAISTHAVRVTLTGEPKHIDQFAPGDALNAATWTVVNLTTGRPLVVALAEMHDALSVDITTIDALGDHLETLEVTAVDLVSIDGLLAESPLSATFLGVVQTVDPIDVAQQDFRDRDIANPPFQISRELGHAGTLVFGSDGDLDTESGEALVRKLVLRRMTTRRGAFPHLPTYGLDLAEKEPLPNGGDLVAFLRDVEVQAKQEPDVETALAKGSMDRSGVLIIALSLEITGGAVVNVRMGSRAGRIMEI